MTALTSDQVTLGALLPQLTAANPTDLLMICRPGSTTPLFAIPVSVLILAAPVAVVASELMGAGAFAHYDNNGGVGSMRNAVASDPTLYANGFVLDTIAMGATGLFYPFGMNTAASPSITLPAPMVWLSDVTPGGFSSSPPTASDHIIQELGPAVLGSGVAFQRSSPRLI